MEIINDDHIFKNLPFNCPICGDKIEGHCESWIEAEKGFMKADDLKLECVSEPDIEDNKDDWEEWFSWHYSYTTDWLPLEIKAMKWVNERYRFKDS